VLLWAAATAPAADQGAVGAGFLSVVERLAADAPALVAIDDVQWLDASSVSAVAFAARRLSGRIGVLMTARTDPESGGASWLQLPRPEMISRVSVPPVSLGGLHVVLAKRLGRSFTRPTMVRIHEVSGGNPFYALELARVMDADADRDAAFPGTLAELVRTRIGNLSADVQEVLLGSACLAAPTVEQIARAIDSDVEDIARLLEEAESQGIIEIEGQHLHFTHPLLARGVYTTAAPARRRAMHRRLAKIVHEPELRGRHLALAAVHGDPETLKALDEAIEHARIRGAPAAAAELLGLAIRLGGDSPQRRIVLARHHLAAGDLGRSRKLLEGAVNELVSGPSCAEALSVFASVCLLDSSFLEAADSANRALADMTDQPALRVQTLITLSLALLNTGRFKGALRNAENAVADAKRLGQSQLLSLALGMRVMLRFMGGGSLDAADMRRALELEDQYADIPVAFRPSMCNAQVLAWTGQLEEARKEMLAIRQRCLERGDEGELVFIAVHRFQIDSWRGDFAEAALVAEDAMERARQLGGDFPLAAALTLQTVLAVFAGREPESRRAAAEAMEAATRCGASLLIGWQIAALGFLEASLGNYEAALETLLPLHAVVGANPEATEIITASYLPDAIEAMVSLGRLDEAGPLIDRLETNGRRLDRAWMLAVGARCRAMLLAARGDIDAATATAHQAMTVHERLPMPFERARTQLLLGQLQRRQRHKGVAASTLSKALKVFEGLDTPLWAERARAELARATLDLSRTAELTVSEQRVAELVTSGMTNRDVAAAMFISPKTVEANLSRIYRKLGIRSRAELALFIGKPAS
jgi:DNA-binding CsgD family transcriptional regulator